ncbi:MAG: UvrABC system protein C [Candidatus Peregrinibacteria bacterium Greene0416_19]|nr:MAG: UvrABC system protein C [Candidatus Peregrinibacteria bacterium Greene0416_19]
MCGIAYDSPVPNRGRTAPKKKVAVLNPHLDELRKRVATAPAGPGIYKWKDAEGTVLYVGKAKNLKNRLRSYVQMKDASGPWKQSFLRQIADFEVTVVGNEIEALILETNLIKELRPKYNVLMKDDKNYVYARVTVQDPFPRVETVRRFDPHDGAKYFGPMLSGSELVNTLTMLRKIFPFRMCRMEIEPVSQPKNPSPHPPSLKNPSPHPLAPSPDGGGGMGGGGWSIKMDVVCTHKDRPTPCLDHHIGSCTAPCVGTKTPEEYFRESIDGVIRFLKGDYESVKDLVKVKMRQAALEKKFELAAQLRDYLGTIERLQSGQQIITDTTGEDSDVIAVALLSGRADVCVMYRRGGKLIGDSCFSLSGQAESEAGVLAQFLPQYYGDGIDIPGTLIVSEELLDAKTLEGWLTGLKGRKVQILLPERGRKSHLLQLAEKNVQEKARQRELKWEAARGNAENAQRQLQEILHLPVLPHRIECYDISHLGGTETVGSMTVAIAGRAANDQYRSFTIRSLKEGDVDDYKALQEVLTRRIRRLVEDLPAEQEKWKGKGVTFGKALKKEQEQIETISRANPGDIGSDMVDYRDYVVARHGGAVIGMARLFVYPPKIPTIRSVWVHDAWRGNKLGQFLVRKILRGLKRGKMYLHSKASLEDYYAAVGFRHVLTPPPALREKLERFHAEHPDAEPSLIMVYDASQNKIDVSLSSCPDLLVIDGGKGQLSAVTAVLQKFGVQIPVIGLAKREEEVFVPDRSTPLLFPPDSPAKFLLMRLRDEAHRFANHHREKRGMKQMKKSALDEIPGIGEETKVKLLKKFGSVGAIKAASDGELLVILSEGQLRELRRLLPLR